VISFGPPTVTLLHLYGVDPELIDSPTEGTRLERPDEDVDVDEIARWMEENFGEALTDGIKEALDDE
jgi:hypothetical protein